MIYACSSKYSLCPVGTIMSSKVKLVKDNDGLAALPYQPQTAWILTTHT